MSGDIPRAIFRFAMFFIFFLIGALAGVAIGVGL